MIRPRGVLARQSGNDEDGPHPSAEGFGAGLRAARTEQGLDLLGVHDRLHCPITQLEALERGDLPALRSLPAATSLVRRYAHLVGLDEDEATRQLTAVWPAELETELATTVVAATGGGAGAGPSGEPTEHLRAFTQTGPVPRVKNRATAPTGMMPAIERDSLGPATGTFPVVPKGDLRRGQRSLNRARRRLRAPRWLKICTWVVAFLLVVVVAGWVLYVRSPQTLADIHVLRTTGTDSPAPATGPGGSSGSAAGTGSGSGSGAAVVTPVALSSQGAGFTVSTEDFTVAIATTGTAWVQVTSSTSATPLVSGVQTAGQHLSFKAKGTMIVQVGSKAAIVAVVAHGKTVYLNQPTVAPFTYTFAPKT